MAAVLSYFPRNNLHGRSKKLFVQYRVTPIVSKIFESIVMKWVDHILPNIDHKQFGGGAGTPTTDAFVEMERIDMKLQIDAGPM